VRIPVTRVLLDSWAWLAVFQGTQAGKTVLHLVLSAERVYTTTANVYEVLYRVSDDSGPDAALAKLEFMNDKAIIQDVTLPIALLAVKLRKSEKLAAIDSFTLAAARTLDATLVTGDPDFRKVKGVKYVGA
jgi:predicted nucleic acid-binding protein